MISRKSDNVSLSLKKGKFEGDVDKIVLIATNINGVIEEYELRFDSEKQLYDLHLNPEKMFITHLCVLEKVEGKPVVKIKFTPSKADPITPWFKLYLVKGEDDELAEKLYNQVNEQALSAEALAEHKNGDRK